MTWIDIMGVDATRQSRWDKHDGETSIAALDGALVAAGLPDRLAAPRRLLAQAEALAGQARTSKDAARNRLQQANRALFADGPVDVGGYGATLVECGPWLSEEAPGMVGVMQAVAQIRVTQRRWRSLWQPVCTPSCRRFAAVSSRRPRRFPFCRAAVVVDFGRAGVGVAVRAGREADWAALVRAGIRWDAVHDAAQLLRETGTFGAQMNFSCPTAIGVRFLNWLPAVDGLPELLAVAGAAAAACRCRLGLGTRAVAEIRP